MASIKSSEFKSEISGPTVISDARYALPKKKIDQDFGPTSPIAYLLCRYQPLFVIPIGVWRVFPFFILPFSFVQYVFQTR